MRSALAKVLHPLAGRPLVAHVLELARQLMPQHLLVVVGHQAEAVEAVCRPYGACCVVQQPQLGTGHAVAQCAPRLAGFAGEVVVLSGDVPLLRPATVQALCAEHRRQQAAVTLLTATLAEPHGYGRIVRDAQGRVVRIVEERDATPAEKAIGEVNSGIYCFHAPFLFAALRRVGRNNAQGEQYLTDVVALAVAEGLPVAAVAATDPEEITGVNTRLDLARLEARLRLQRCQELMLAGVTIQDPASTVIEAPVQVGPDTVIAPHTHLLGHSVLGPGCHVGPHVVIRDSVLGEGVRVEPFCLLEACQVAAHTTVPPFSHLHP